MTKTTIKIVGTQNNRFMDMLKEAEVRHLSRLKENGLIAKEEKNEEVCYEYEPSNQ